MKLIVSNKIKQTIESLADGPKSNILSKKLTDVDYVCFTISSNKNNFEYGVVFAAKAGLNGNDVYLADFGKVEVYFSGASEDAIVAALIAASKS